MKRSTTKKSTYDQLRLTDEHFIWKYSPNQTPPDLLEAIFVGRESLLQNVLEKIADSALSGSTHNVLVFGPRGIGKSHFISLLHHRLTTDQQLSESLRIAWLNEDETTTSVVQLLVRIYRSLCKWYPTEFSIAWLDELLNQSPDEVTAILTRRLADRFNKRRLVVLVENLNILFENLGIAGQQGLRTFLQENPIANLIATSQQLFKAVTDRSEPFFGFFQSIQLKPLSLTDAIKLLIKIAETKGQTDLVQFLGTPDGRGRIRAIHDLAGGNHRVYIVLSGFVTRESLDNLIGPFQKMADELTPYYQERFRWISPLQRQIVELLCQHPGTVNPKEIARRLLLDQRSIGKQVRLLEQIGYLSSTKSGRETHYELAEPLMRLAYEVKEQSLLRMLVEFLRIWYRTDEMQNLQAARLSQAIQGYSDAPLEPSQRTTDPRVRLLTQEIKNAEVDGRMTDLAMLWEEKSKALFALDRWKEGFDCIREALNNSQQDWLGNTASMFAIIFNSTRNTNELHDRVGKLVDAYQFAASRSHFRQKSLQIEASVVTEATLVYQCSRTTENPLLYLGAGLVKSLGKIKTDNVPHPVLQSFVSALEQRVNGLAEFDIPLRLFRCGINYLISGKESEIVSLVQLERQILRQALGLLQISHSENLSPVDE